MGALARRIESSYQNSAQIQRSEILIISTSALYFVKKAAVATQLTLTAVGHFEGKIGSKSGNWHQKHVQTCHMPPIQS